MLQTINPQAGLWGEDSDYAAQGRYVDGENIRFWKGLPEKIGGNEALIEDKLDGPARDSHVWSSLDGTPMAAFGTPCSLFLFVQGKLYDITPRTRSTQTFSMKGGSREVTVNHVRHGLVDGQRIEIAGTGAIDGRHLVDSVSRDAYTFLLPEKYPRTETMVADVDYLIACGNVSGQSGTGYGINPYGFDVYSGSSDIFRKNVNPRIWHLDSWGQNLTANYRGSQMYEWDFTWGPDTPARPIVGAPENVLAHFVTDKDRILVTLGATDLNGDFDPLLVRWSDQENNTEFNPTADNYAGDVRCEIGSQIMGSAPTRNGRLILTDRAAYLLRFIGQPFVYALDLVDDDCGLIGPHAITTMDGRAYWMSHEEFFVFDGAVNRLPCSLEYRLFHSDQRLDPRQAFLIHAGRNSRFNELVWHYARMNETEVSDTISFIDSGSLDWSRGTVARTTWVDDNEMVRYPLSTKPDGTICIHEIGVDDDGDPLPYFVKTADIGLGEGDMFYHVSRMIPDFQRVSGSHTLTVRTMDYPMGTKPKTKKTDLEVAKGTRLRNFRARGRTVSYELSSQGEGTDFRLGRVRVDITPDGRRG